MSKLIAVWGSPNSGKTTFALKLALSIYDLYKSTLIILHPDMETPVLPVLFPNRKSDELCSVGAALAKTEITQDEVIRHMVTVKGKVDFALLGYKDGENRYTYPEYDEQKARSLLQVLGNIADYVIVDCTSRLDNGISDAALKQADHVLRLATPDFKSIVFYTSQMPLYSEPKYRLEEHIQGINIINSDVYDPNEDIRHFYQDICFTLPYCRELKQQMQDGTLFSGVKNNKYRRLLKSITERIV